MPCHPDRVRRSYMFSVPETSCPGWWRADSRRRFIDSLTPDEIIRGICSMSDEVVDLEQSLALARRERDEAREQLQKIGRKAFWAAKDSR